MIRSGSHVVQNSSALRRFLLHLTDPYVDFYVETWYTSILDIYARLTFSGQRTLPCVFHALLAFWLKTAAFMEAHGWIISEVLKRITFRALPYWPLRIIYR